MAIQSKKIEYKDNETLLEGHLVWDDAQTGPQPAVMVAHAWGGQDDFARQRAEDLAHLGYVGFALDMYGKGVSGSNVEECSALMTPLVQNRAALQKRMYCALETLRAQEQVDAQQVAAMGYCFGGLCVLDLARMGADVKAVVSFHGLLSRPENLTNNKITANVLILHGYQDTMAKPEDLAAIQQELDAHEIDWQSYCYGQAYHAFTNPKANDPDFGTVYNDKADKRSWRALCAFLNESFG